jgi:hypothetical protein
LVVARAACGIQGRDGCSRRPLRSSGGPLQTKGAPLIGEARREVHEAGYAIIARQRPCACGVDQSRVEEGRGQHHANGARGAIVRGGEFCDVGIFSFDQPLEPEARGGDGEDQALAIPGFESAALALVELGTRMARRTCEAGFVQGTDNVSAACRSLRSARYPISSRSVQTTTRTR